MPLRSRRDMQGLRPTGLSTPGRITTTKDLALRDKTLKGEGFAKGGEVKQDKSPNSGMITKRGWGASRKT